MRKPCLGVLKRDRASERIVRIRLQALSVHDREPACFREQFIRLAEDASCSAIDPYALLQTFWNRHRPNVIPVGRVGALRRMEVKDEEVADTLELLCHQAVVTTRVGWFKAARRQHLEQAGDGRLDQMDAG